MSYRKRLFIILGLTVCFLPSVHAETTVERSSQITLNTLVQNLYKKHPVHQVDLAYQQQADANTNLANTLFAEPASISAQHFNDVIGSSDGFQEWEASVEIPLWLPGEKEQQLKLSEHLLAELPAYKQQIMLEVSANVRNLVWQIANAEAASSYAYQIWQSAKTLEKDVVLRVEAGDLAGTDGLLAKTHTLDMHSNYLESNATLMKSVANYQHITGEQLLPESINEILSDNTQIDGTHPVLAAYDQKITTLRTKQNLARYEGASHTNVSVGVRRERGDGSESFNHSLGLGVSFVLDDMVYRQPAIANAAREIADVQVARQRLETELNSALVSSLQDLKSKQQQLLLSEEHIETTQRYLNLQKRTFDSGELELVAYLNSQKLAAKSLSRKHVLEIDIKRAIAKINQALGILL